VVLFRVHFKKKRKFTDRYGCGRLGVLWLHETRVCPFDRLLSYGTFIRITYRSVVKKFSQNVYEVTPFCFVLFV